MKIIILLLLTLTFTKRSRSITVQTKGNADIVGKLNYLDSKISLLNDSSL